MTQNLWAHGDTITHAGNQRVTAAAPLKAAQPDPKSRAGLSQSRSALSLQVLQKKKNLIKCFPAANLGKGEKL